MPAFFLTCYSAMNRIVIAAIILVVLMVLGFFALQASNKDPGGDDKDEPGAPTPCNTWRVFDVSSKPQYLPADAVGTWVYSSNPNKYTTLDPSYSGQQGPAVAWADGAWRAGMIRTYAGGKTSPVFSYPSNKCFKSSTPTKVYTLHRDSRCIKNLQTLSAPDIAKTLRLWDGQAEFGVCTTTDNSTDIQTFTSTDINGNCRDTDQSGCGSFGIATHRQWAPILDDMTVAA